MSVIFEFLDYRDYLRQHYEQRKVENSLFSYRVMANGMGMDASYLAKVITKALHLGPKQVAPTVAYLKLTKPERTYFELLVRFAKAKTAPESEAIFSKLAELRPIGFRSLQADQHEVFRSWIHPALRALLGVVRFDGQYRELGALLEPQADATSTKEAVKLLESLQLVKRTADGDCIPSDAHVGTGSLFRPAAVRSFQRQASQLQVEAIDRFPKEERDISTLTVAADKSALQDIRELVRNCRRAIQKRIDDVQEPDRVFQVNLGIFPLSKTVPQSQRKSNS